METWGGGVRGSCRRAFCADRFLLASIHFSRLGGSHLRYALIGDSRDITALKSFIVLRFLYR